MPTQEQNKNLACSCDEGWTGRFEDDLDPFIADVTKRRHSGAFDGMFAALYKDNQAWHVNFLEWVQGNDELKEMIQEAQGIAQRLNAQKAEQRAPDDILNDSQTSLDAGDSHTSESPSGKVQPMSSTAARPEEDEDVPSELVSIQVKVQSTCSKMMTTVEVLPTLKDADKIVGILSGCPAFSSCVGRDGFIRIFLVDPETIGPEGQRPYVSRRKIEEASSSTAKFEASMRLMYIGDMAFVMDACNTTNSDHIRKIAQSSLDSKELLRYELVNIYDESSSRSATKRSKRYAPDSIEHLHLFTAQDLTQQKKRKRIQYEVLQPCVHIWMCLDQNGVNLCKWALLTRNCVGLALRLTHPHWTKIQHRDKSDAWAEPRSICHLCGASAIWIG